MTKRFVIAIAVAGAARVAAAQPDETADMALKRGNTAMKAGRIHEACEAFEAADKLDTKIETELRLADCYEQDGRLMTSVRLYQHLAESDANQGRRKTSMAKATALEARAPRLRFAISQRPEGLVIKVDGVEVPTTGDVRVDLGPHEVLATAPGFEGHANVAVDRERAAVDVIIRMQPKAEAAPPKAEPKLEPKAEPKAEPMAEPKAEPKAEPMAQDRAPEEPTGGGSRRKTYGIVSGAAGVGLVVGAIVMLDIAAGKFDDEDKLCGHATCATQHDLDRANALLDNGRTLRNVGIGVGIAGVALIGTGAYLLLTPHHEASHMSFNVSPGNAGVAYTVRF